MSKAKYQLYPQLLQVRGPQPKRLNQLCEFIHYGVPNNQQYVTLRQLYAYYPVTEHTPGVLSKYLVRTSQNPFYRLSYKDFVHIAKAYLEMMMRVMIETGAQTDLPEYSGLLRITKVKRPTVNIPKFIEALAKDKNANRSDFFFYNYRKNHSYVFRMEWKKRNFVLLRHYRWYFPKLKPKGRKLINEMMEEDPHLIYNLKTFRP